MCLIRFAFRYALQLCFLLLFVRLLFRALICIPFFSGSAVNAVLKAHRNKVFVSQKWVLARFCPSSHWSCVLNSPKIWLFVGAQARKTRQKEKKRVKPWLSVSFKSTTSLNGDYYTSCIHVIWEHVLPIERHHLSWRKWRANLSAFFASDFCCCCGSSFSKKRCSWCWWTSDRDRIEREISLGWMSEMKSFNI